jgi:hypothetical protein
VFLGIFGEVRGIKRDFHVLNDMLWRCCCLSSKFKARSTGLSTDILSRRQISHRSNVGLCGSFVFSWWTYCNLTCRGISWLSADAHAAKIILGWRMRDGFCMETE